MRIIKLFKRQKTQEQLKREEIFKLASIQFKEIIKMGSGFPVIAYKI